MLLKLISRILKCNKNLIQFNRNIRTGTQLRSNVSHFVLRVIILYYDRQKVFNWS